LFGAEGVGAAGEEQTAIADFDELAVGTADHLAFEDALIGRIRSWSR
jgi:hypothetical protein